MTNLLTNARTCVQPDRSTKDELSFVPKNTVPMFIAFVANESRRAGWRYVEVQKGCNRAR